jgi:hypothetical protein
VDVGKVIGDSGTAKETRVLDEGFKGVDFVAKGTEELVIIYKYTYFNI